MGNSITVRSHLRGLQVLQALNRHNFASVLDLSRETDLPRPTIYRLLETLIEAGFVLHDKDSDVFCLSAQVRELSCGFDAKAHAIDVARPFVKDFSAEICWPSYMFAQDGDAMVPRLIVRSPRALAYPKLSKRFSFTASAPGRLYLASLSTTEREVILAREASHEVERTQQFIRDAGALGCGYRDEGIVPRTCSISLPIRHQGRPQVYWTIVFMRSVLSVNKALDMYLPQARRVVRDIEEQLETGA
jgi:DNA-binding IclR family transcriptional regulator